MTFLLSPLSSSWKRLASTSSEEVGVPNSRTSTHLEVAPHFATIPSFQVSVICPIKVRAGRATESYAPSMLVHDGDYPILSHVKTKTYVGHAGSFAKGVHSKNNQTILRVAYNLVATEEKVQPVWYLCHVGSTKHTHTEPNTPKYTNRVELIGRNWLGESYTNSPTHQPESLPKNENHQKTRSLQNHKSPFSLGNCPGRSPVVALGSQARARRSRFPAMVAWRIET